MKLFVTLFWNIFNKIHFPNETCVIHMVLLNFQYTESTFILIINWSFLNPYRHRADCCHGLTLTNRSLLLCDLNLKLKNLFLPEPCFDLLFTVNNYLWLCRQFICVNTHFLLMCFFVRIWALLNCVGHPCRLTSYDSRVATHHSTEGHLFIATTSILSPQSCHQHNCYF